MQTPIPTDALRHDFAERLEAHRRMVFKVANSYAAGAADREDLAQEITVQLWRAFPGYDPTRPFSTWLYRIALNVAISHLRREGPRQRQTVPLALHAFGIGLIIDAIVRMLLIARINMAAPVVTIQRHVAYLRRWEIRSFKWVWMIVWALGPAMLIVLAQAVAGADLWARWPAGIAWTAAICAIGMMLSYAFDRLTRNRWPNLYVGHSVEAAQAVLDEIDAFARE